MALFFIKWDSKRENVVRTANKNVDDERRNKMNIAQKIILFIGLVAFVLAGAWDMANWPDRVVRVQMLLLQLLVIWVTVGVATTGLICIFRGKKSPEAQQPINLNSGFKVTKSILLTVIFVMVMLVAIYIKIPAVPTTVNVEGTVDIGNTPTVEVQNTPLAVEVENLTPIEVSVSR